MQLEQIKELSENFIPSLNSTAASPFSMANTSSIDNEEWELENIKDWLIALCRDRQKYPLESETTPLPGDSEIVCEGPTWISNSISLLDEIMNVGTTLFQNSRPLEYDEAVELDRLFMEELIEENRNES